MLIHSVYFWFKPDADPQIVADFEAGLRKLATIPQIQQAHLGRPEQTPPRPVIDQSYDWGLVVHFASLADHDAYQEHAIHAEFLERFQNHWLRVQVYDLRV
jgi:Stress responsive A/B Barrel Domain